MLLLAPGLAAQEPTPLTIDQAREAAHQASPTLRAAREAVAAARARERQAGAHPNPTLSYGREQASGGGQANAQDVAQLEQAIDIGNMRGARRDASRVRRQAAEVRLAQAGRELDYEVTRAYALAVAAGRRARSAAHAADAFTVALRVSEQRLAAGDVAGLAHRRLRLEATRYAIGRAEADLAARTATATLAALIRPATAPIAPHPLLLLDTVPHDVAPPGADSLLTLALRARGDLRAIMLEAEAADAEARLAARERVPMPVLSAGYKGERISPAAGSDQLLDGFVAGVALPLPIFDRRSGALEAAQADARQRRAEVDAAQRRVAREVSDARDAYAAARQQVELLAPAIGTEARAALAAADVAYAEGEITLVEWLDVVRAYREAEAGYAALQGELMIRLAALERAVGAPLPTTTRGPDGSPRN